MNVDYSVFVDENGVEKWWVFHFKRHEKLLLNALEYCGGTHNLEDVAMALHNDYMQFFPANESFLVTEVVQHPRLKSLHIFLAGGSKDELVEISKYVFEHARTKGCTRMTSTGRRGWERVLPNIFNCKPSHYWLSMEI
jgi:hypothetical protein